MTRAALVNHVAATVQLPKNQTAAVITGFLQGRVDALHGGDQVAWRGFGSCRLRHRQGTCRTPPTHRQHDPDPSQSDPLVDCGQTFQETVPTAEDTSGGADDVSARRHTA